MNFEFTEEQKMFRNAIAEFVDKEIKPIAKDMDEKGEFPKDLFQKMGGLGYFGLRYPEEVGGSETDFMTFCIACEEIARGSLALAASMAMQSLMSTDFIFRFGTEEHKRNIVEPTLRGEKIGGFALTEPGAGTDLGGMKTHVEKDGDEFVLQGSKTWITSGTVGDFFTVAAKTDLSKKGTEGIDFFLVERGTPGFSTGKKIDTLGTRSSEVTELFFDNCRIPESNFLGTEIGKGFLNLRAILNEIRTMTGALSLGIARAALEEALQYSKDRVQFGRPIGKFQAIQVKLADMAVDFEAAKLLVYQAAWRIDQELPNTKEAAIAKLYASEMANRTADSASRILGSYSFALDFNAQRYFRDARFLLFGGGTSEILRLMIQREL